MQDLSYMHFFTCLSLQSAFLINGEKKKICEDNYAHYLFYISIKKLLQKQPSFNLSRSTINMFFLIANMLVSQWKKIVSFVKKATVNLKDWHDRSVVKNASSVFCTRNQHLFFVHFIGLFFYLTQKSQTLKVTAILPQKKQK